MYEKEKIKIRLSEWSYGDLENDMKIMRFYKPNGSLNKNKFFLHLIKGMYQDYLATNEHIKEVLYADLDEEIDIKVASLANRINQYNVVKRYSDRNVFYYNKNIYIQITKQSRNMFNEIEYSLLDNLTLSEFIRCLFHQYILMSRYERERCILFDIYSCLDDIYRNQLECVIKTKDNETFKFQIVYMFIKPEENYRIIKGFKILEDKKELINLKFVDVEYITPLKSNIVFNNDEMELIKKEMEE